MLAYIISLLVGSICAAGVLAYSNLGNATCSKLIEYDETFDCVATSECSSLSQLIHDGKVALCGNDAGTVKICCPNTSARFARQVEAAPPKDPYAVAKQKCNQYSETRYVDKVFYSEIPNKPPIIRRKLDCVKAQPLIHGGKPAILKELPHMALIGFNDRSDSPNDAIWACGGTLISDRYVLTAAHCMKREYSDAKWVRLGELIIDNDNDNAEPKDFRVIERIPHPRYNSSFIYHDIMLLKLDTRVEFTSHIRPICLYTSTAIVPILNNKALISGWGPKVTGERNSEALLKAKLDFVDDSECKATYRGDAKLPRGYDANSMICAGDKIKGHDTCTGDSGGPLQVPIPEWACMYSQVGITSYGSFICGQKSISAIYTKIAPYIPWIQSIVWP